jgi:AraC family transcriptional regulator of adaptative response / DNA-3-methyladenine glycosylase II
VGGRAGYFGVSLDEEHHSLRVQIQCGDPGSLFFIVERIRAMFDLNADWTDIARILKSDPALKNSVESRPGLRVPGSWNGFELATRAILGQQVSVRGATTLAGRLVKQFGLSFCGTESITHLFPAPEILADANLADVGLTKARAETIRLLARSVRDGRISFDGIVDCESFLERLQEIPGIGRWTAQYVAMRALGEPDAFPTGDLALLSALQSKSWAEVARRAEAWRPWRAYATMYLWSRPHEHKDDGGVRNSGRPLSKPLIKTTARPVPLGRGPTAGDAA